MFRYRFWIFVFVIIAVACVASIVSLSRYRRHHAELLLLLVANQADSVFRSDTLQRRLVRYFDRYAYTPDGILHPGRTANDRLLAHYLLGRAYADIGDAPMAIHAYREAVDCADTTRTDCDYAVLRSVYGQMEYLYNEQNLPHLQLEALSRCEHFNLLLGDTVEALSDFARRMGVYHLLGDTDSVMIVFEDAKKLFMNRMIPESLRGFYVYPLSIHLDRQEFPAARDLLDDVKKDNRFFDRINTPAKGYELYYYYLGQLYAGTGQLDSAVTCFRQALRYGYDEAGYKGLLSAYKSMGNMDSTYKYAMLFAESNDKSHNSKRTDAIIHASHMYDYTHNLEEANRIERQNSRLRIIILFILIVVATISSILHHLYKRHRKEKENSIKLTKQYAELMQTYRKTRYDIALLGKNKDKLLKELSAKEMELKNLLNAETTGKDNVFRRIFDSCAYRQLENLTLPQKTFRTASDEEWDEVMTMLKEVVSLFYYKLCKSSLSENEKRVCICTALHFTSKETTIISGLSSSQVSNMKTSISKKMFGETSSMTLDRKLMYILS